MVFVDGRALSYIVGCIAQAVFRFLWVAGAFSSSIQQATATGFFFLTLSLEKRLEGSGSRGNARKANSVEQIQRKQYTYSVCPDHLPST